MYVVLPIDVLVLMLFQLNASSTSVVPSDCQDIDCSMFSFFFTMTTAKQELW